MDRDPYGSSIFPLSIAPWWELLKEKGLFDANDTSLYGTEMSSIHAFLAAFVHAHFSCSGDGGHAYYALVKAFKCDYNLGKQSFLTAFTCHLPDTPSLHLALKEIMLVTLLIDVLKKQFSPSHKFWKRKAETISKLKKQLSTSCTSCSLKFANDLHLMTKLSIANDLVKEVHYKMMLSIIHHINDAHVPNNIIQTLGLNYIIHFMRIYSSYPLCLVQNINVNFNQCITSLMYKLNHDTFISHPIETWLDILNLFDLDQRIEVILQFVEKFINWALPQSDAALFIATPRSAWEPLASIDGCVARTNHYTLQAKIRAFRTRIKDYYQLYDA